MGQIYIATMGKGRLDKIRKHFNTEIKAHRPPGMSRQQWARAKTEPFFFNAPVENSEGYRKLLQRFVVRGDMVGTSPQTRGLLEYIHNYQSRLLIMGSVIDEQLDFITNLLDTAKVASPPTTTPQDTLLYSNLLYQATQAYLQNFERTLGDLSVRPTDYQTLSSHYARSISMAKA